MSSVLSPRRIAASLTELWSPRVIADLDDNFVKVAKVHGELAWHSHHDEDELFLVLEGRLRLEFDDAAIADGSMVELGPGELFVVPKGVRHHPVADTPTLILLIERKSTLHTGREQTAQTRSIDEQQRPFDDPA